MAPHIYWVGIKKGHDMENATSLSAADRSKIAQGIRAVMADTYALYVKTQMKLLRHAMGTERDDEEPKVRGILGEKRDRDDDSSDSDIWDHDSDGTGSREDDCSEDELYEKIADLPPRGWW